MKKYLRLLKNKKPYLVARLRPLKSKKSLWTMLAICLIATTAYAARTPISGSADARVKKVTYHANDVYRLKGHYGYSSTIQFEDAERIETISIGDSEAWQIIKPHRQNILFVKPLEKNAATNMTVITSKRIYSFEMSAEVAENNGANDLTFLLKFVYTDTGNKGMLHFDTPKNKNLNAVSPEEWNFEYSFTGDNALRPQRVFDDGKFTYFQFDNIGVLPAVFLIDDKGKESVVNSSIHGSNLVIHRVGPQFKLRDGDLETVIFNETWPQPTGKERGIVPVSALEERKPKTASSRKKRRSGSNSFLASFTPSDGPPVYNR